MSSLWAQEKKRLMSFSPEKWQKRWSDMSAVVVQDIPTWKEYSRIKMKINSGAGKPEGNEEEFFDLSSHVSLFSGDITTQVQ